MGRRLALRAGRCPKDRLYECTHCTWVSRRCPVCGTRVGDAAGAVLFIGVFMLVIAGSFVSALIFPIAANDARLDSLPITPLAELTNGQTAKVYAAIAPNQTDVVYGYYANQTWTYIVRPFLLAENGTAVLVNTSRLLYLRPPGTAWGGSTGTILYSSGDVVAVYGSVTETSNETVLFAQYISDSPNDMGRLSGDTWPLVVAIDVLFGAFCIVGGIVVGRQRRLHASILATRHPSLPPPEAPPASVDAVARVYSDGSASKRRQQTRKMFVAGPFAAIAGIALLTTDLFLPIFLGLFLLMIGGFFLLLATGERLRRYRDQESVIADERGLHVIPVMPAAYPDDQFFLWRSVTSFWVYQFGRFGRIVGVRTLRGEFIINSFTGPVIDGVKSELVSHGVPEERESTSSVGSVAGNDTLPP